MAILILALVIIIFFTRKRQAASHKKRVTSLFQTLNPVEDAKNTSIIAVGEIDGNSLSRYKEIMGAGIFELPHAPSPSELTGSDTTLVPNIRDPSTGPGQLAEISITNPLDQTPPAPDLDRAIPPIPCSESGRFSWIKHNTILFRPSGCQGDASSPVPDLNRALPPIPRSESGRFSWITRNTIPARPSGCRGIATSPVRESRWALPTPPRLESMRFSWIRGKLTHAKQSDSQEIARSDVDGGPEHAREMFF